MEYLNNFKNENIPELIKILFEKLICWKKKINQLNKK